MEYWYEAYRVQEILTSEKAYITIVVSVEYFQDIIVSRDTEKLGMGMKEGIQVILEIWQAYF